MHNWSLLISLTNSDWLQFYNSAIFVEELNFGVLFHHCRLVAWATNRQFLRLQRSEPC